MGTLSHLPFVRTNNQKTGCIEGKLPFACHVVAFEAFAALQLSSIVVCGIDQHCCLSPQCRLRPKFRIGTLTKIANSIVSGPKLTPTTTLEDSCLMPTASMHQCQLSSIEMLETSVCFNFCHFQFSKQVISLCRKFRSFAAKPTWKRHHSGQQQQVLCDSLNSQ